MAVSRELSKLENSERELLYKAPLLVCILIAGADGQMDDREIAEAVSMMRKRNWVKSSMAAFFQELAADFEDKIKIVIQSYPFKVEQRNQQITRELAEVNKLWRNLEPEFSVAYYDVLKRLAHGVAKSSGKFWGKIGPEEAQLLDLPMIKDPSKN